MTHPIPEDDAAANPELSALAAELPPPPGVLPSLVRQLSQEGLIHQRRRWWSVALQAAAMLTIGFVAGWTVPRATPQMPETPHGTRYMLLLYGAAAPGDDSRVDEYRAWAVSVARRGIRVSGEKLADGSTPLGNPRGVPAGAELNGFFMIDVATDAEAMALAEGHPHVRHGGTIVIRRIEPT